MTITVGRVSNEGHHDIGEYQITKDTTTKG